MTTTLRYPLRKLFDNDDWFSIEIYEHKPGQFSAGGFATEDQGAQGPLLAQICLPMPWNIPNNSQSAGWGDSSFDALSAAVADIASTGIDEGMVEAGKNFLSKGKNLLEEATKGSNINTISGGLSLLAASAITGTDPAAALSRFTGVTFNNNVELAFKGVSLRPANTFTFNLTPRNKSESEQIRQIIKILKVNMSASRNSARSAGGIFLTVPNVFKIKYMKGKSEHPFLNKFKVCALSDLTVDLSPSGYATYDDATPVEMNLGLKFQELTPIYRENYVEDKSTTISY